MIETADRAKISDLIARQRRIAAPDLIQYELGNTLRKHFLIGDLSEQAAMRAFANFKLMILDLYEAPLLETRAWELRHNATFYDASYIALAEILECPLYTSDRKLAGSSNHRAKIIVL